MSHSDGSKPVKPLVAKTDAEPLRRLRANRELMGILLPNSPTWDPRARRDVWPRADSSPTRRPTRPEVTP